MKKIYLAAMLLAASVSLGQITPLPPVEATVTQVNAGTSRTTFVSPYDLAHWTGAGATWGSITGTLSNQADLNTALGLKASLASLGTGAFQPQTVLAGTANQIAVSNSGVGATTISIPSSAVLPGSPTVGGTASTAAGGIVTTDGTQTLLNKTLTGGVLGSSTATTQSAGDNSTKVATTAYVDTLSATPVVETLADAATVTITGTKDGGILTTLSQTTTLAAPSGSPNQFHRYILRIKSTSARTLTFTTGSGGFRGSADLSLPSATSGGSLTDYLVFEYNTQDTRYDLVGRTFGF